MDLLALLEAVTARLNHALWGVPMVLLLFSTHLYMTCRTGFIQRKALTAIRLSLTPDPDGQGDISPFASLTTALASTIGTGNIVGVGTAIALGGPGAVFWCWIAGIFGMATKYAESLIAVRFRVKSADGRMMGGAMYALERGLNLRGLALLFALFGALASLGIGCGVQVNALSQAVTRLFPAVEPWSVGLAACVTAALAIFGGVKGLGRVCERLVPFMAIFFVMGCTVILWQCRDVLPAACRAIVTMAFRPGAAAGGLVGSGIIAAARYGIARGLFSNESGMGSAPIVAAAAQCRNPVRQALVASMGTFWDTVVLCLVTGVTLVASIMKNPAIDISGITDGGELSALAFGQIPYVGPLVLNVGLITFAYSTILGWSYYGERCVEYLLGPRALTPYRLLYLSVLAVAPALSLGLVWDISDVLNALMALPNLIALIGLSPLIARETRYYLPRLDEQDLRPIPTADPAPAYRRWTNQRSSSRKR